MKPAMISVGDVSDIMSKIEEYLQQVDVNIKGKVAIVRKHFERDNGEIDFNRLKDVYTNLKPLLEHIPKFTSGDPVRLLQGVSGVVLTVSSYTGLGGPAVPVICEMLSNVFSSFGGKTLTIGEVVEGEIRRVFAMHSDETLLEEAEDLHLMYRFAYDFLNPTSGKSEFSEHDITNMNIQMNVFQGVGFLRKLGKLIKELAKEHKENDEIKKAEQARKAMQFVELYIKLALLRDMILLNFFTITNSTAHSQHLAGGIQRVMGSFKEQDREALGMFFKPTKEYVFIVSYFMEQECELLSKFLEQEKQLLPDHNWLTNGDIELCSVKWPKHRAIRLKGHRSIFGNGDLRFLRGTNEAVGPESLFCFQKISERNNYFNITQRRESTDIVRMTKGPQKWVMALKESPKPENEWKVIQMENGNYVFSPRAFPGYFMGMTKLLDGSIAGFLGGYCEQVHWTLRATE